MTEDESLPRANVNAPGEQKGAAPSRGAAKAPAATTGAGAWKRRLITMAGPLALTAAMLVYVFGQRGPNGPALPEYTVAATGAPAASGSAVPETRLRLAKSAGRGARFELVLRPAAQPEEPVVAYAFTFSTPSSEPVPLEAKVEIAPEGGIRLTGSARALEDAREIRIVVGAPAAIGKFVDAAARAAASTTDAQVRVLSVAIDRE